jgi:hypothetical protein
MNPTVLALGAVGLAAAGYFAFRNKGPAIDRGATMVRLADILYRIIGRKGFTKDEPMEAVNLANALGMPKTVAGIQSSKGLPNDETWPGSSLSVAAYMYEYTKNRDAPPPPPPPPPPGAPGPKVYNDQTPVAGIEDPRQVRAMALSLEKQGKGIEAKIYHAKADALNKIIGAAKARNSLISTGKGVTSAVKSLGGLFKG